MQVVKADQNKAFRRDGSQQRNQCLECPAAQLRGIGYPDGVLLHRISDAIYSFQHREKPGKCANFIGDEPVETSAQIAQLVAQVVHHRVQRLERKRFVFIAAAPQEEDAR